VEFLTGLFIGMATLFITGPVFFTLIKNSIQYGYPEGIATASGIILSDVLVFLICYYTTGTVMNDLVEHPVAHLTASLLLMGFGLKFLIKPLSAAKENGKSNGKSTIYKAMMQGFFINFVNPFVFIIWIGLIAYGETKFNTQLALFIFVLGLFAGIYSTDLLKVFFAQRIKSILRSRHLIRLYQIIGVVLIGFSLRIIVLLIV
jgi:threonine/homoserine/homoserine lactone efflux protein